MTKQNKRIVPAFATEAEEADWWYKNRNIHDKQLLAAPRSGEAKIFTNTKEELLRRIEASKKRPAPVVALRIPAEDLALARKQAGQKGLPYQARDACQARKSKGRNREAMGPETQSILPGGMAGYYFARYSRSIRRFSTLAQRPIRFDVALQ
jgi:predicted DNA binding CopG/RHH family protein